MSCAKTAISLSPTLLKDVDTLADKLKVSRSRLMCMAASEFIQRYENQTILDALNDAYDNDPSDAITSEHRRHHRHMVKEEW